MATMDRRAALALGTAMLAPAALLPTPAKAELYARHAGLLVMPGVRRIDLGRWPSSLPNYKSIVMTDYILAPGSGLPPETVWYDRICHILEGKVMVRKAREVLINAGDIFVSVKGESQEITNPGEIDAVMRLIALKTR